MSQIRAGAAESRKDETELDLDLTSFQLAERSSVSRAPITAKHGDAPPKASGKGSYSNRLMFAEEPDPLPSGIGEEWVALGPLPKGKRCLAVVNKPQHAGAQPTMTLYSRKEGKPIAIWPSPCERKSSVTESPPEVDMPMQGEEQDKENAGKKKTARQRRIRFPAPPGLPPGTELDCILPSHYQSQEQQQQSTSCEYAGVLFILDVLTWARRSFEDFDTEFRQYWRDARLAELPTPVVPPGTVLEEVKSSTAGSRPTGSRVMRVTKAPYPFLLVPVRAIAAPLSRQLVFSRLLHLQGKDEACSQLHRRKGAMQIAAIRAQTTSEAKAVATDAMQVDRPHARDADEPRGRQESVQIHVPITELREEEGSSASKDGEDDGILLYHRAACYEAGTTPLALWLSPPGWRKLVDEERLMSEREDGD